MSRSVDNSRRQSPWPGPVPASPGDASPDSIAAISNSTAAPASSVSRPASMRRPASSTATTRTCPETPDRLSIRTNPAYPSAADGTYGTVCASSAPQAAIPNTAPGNHANTCHRAITNPPPPCRCPVVNSPTNRGGPPSAS